MSHVEIQMRLARKIHIIIVFQCALTSRAWCRHPHRLHEKGPSKITCLHSLILSSSYAGLERRSGGFLDVPLEVVEYGSETWKRVSKSDNARVARYICGEK